MASHPVNLVCVLSPPFLSDFLSLSVYVCRCCYIYRLLRNGPDSHPQVLALLDFHWDCARPFSLGVQIRPSWVPPWLVSQHWMCSSSAHWTLREFPCWAWLPTCSELMVGVCISDQQVPYLVVMLRFWQLIFQHFTLVSLSVMWWEEKSTHCLPLGLFLFPAGLPKSKVSKKLHIIADALFSVFCIKYGDGFKYS